jgi:hypothetical protein
MLKKDEKFCETLKNAVEECSKVTDPSQWRTINVTENQENPNSLFKTKNLCKYYLDVYAVKCVIQTVNEKQN